MARESGIGLTLGTAYGFAVGLLVVVNFVVLLRLRSFGLRFPTLREWDGPMPETWPKVSVIAPCRNEAAGVERAMSSLLAQDYPNLEIVAVNDRSEDQTGATLAALAARDPRLTVLHIDTLPQGWLGKNNAMHQGAGRAGGSWLLFTDGDVVFEPGALKRSVAFAEAHGLGHFVALPKFVADGFLERAFVSTFGMALGSKLDPAKLTVAKSWAYVGVGAFGLVRREAYQRIGGHERLAFEVADDMKLGLLLRRSGIRQGCLDSDGMVSVRWQNGLLASLRGLEKNAFAGCEWNTAIAAVAVSAVASGALLPYLPLFMTLPGWTHPVAFVAAALPILLVAASARRMSGGTGLEGLVAPLGGLALAGVLAWSTLLALVRGGVIWRGTFYPLDELRKRCVREFGMSADGAVGWTPPTPPNRSAARGVQTRDHARRDAMLSSCAMTQALQDLYAPQNKCFGCGPANEKGLRIKSFVDGEFMVATFTPEPHHEAWEGVVNGGIIGCLFDCHSNWAAAYHLMKKSGTNELPPTVTGDFHVKLKRPTPSKGPLIVKARVVESTEDRATVEATIEVDGVVTSTCRGLFVAVKPGHPAYHRW